MKQFDLVFFSRANFECTQLTTSAANVDDACNNQASVIRDHLHGLYEGSDPQEYGCETIDEVVDQEYDNGEYYLVCAFESSAENKVVF